MLLTRVQHAACCLLPCLVQRGSRRMQQKQKLFHSGSSWLLSNSKRRSSCSKCGSRLQQKSTFCVRAWKVALKSWCRCAAGLYWLLLALAYPAVGLIQQTLLMTHDCYQNSHSIKSLVGQPVHGLN